jgi:hypothetical protein
MVPRTRAHSSSPGGAYPKAYVCDVRRHGEYSGKDYEAIISRALLVKPLARHLQSYPDIYDVNITCIEVRCRR